MRDPGMERIADAIADRADPDWRTGAGASPAVIDALRALSNIARAHGAPDVRSARGGAWGRFHLLEPLGEGVFGVVYRARDRRLGRDVALKLLKPIAGATAARLLAEARLLARVRHPNVVSVYSADLVDGAGAICMELVDGETLQERVRRAGPLPPAEVARAGVQLARALAAVHDARLVHGDVKAQNAMIDREGRCVLMDFGAGIEFAPAAAGPGGEARSSALAATPAYLAPEVFAGARPTAQADLFSLGVLLFHLATGGYPVSGHTFEAVRELHRRGAPPDTRALRRAVPAALAATIERALARSPAERWSTARELGDALARAIPDARARARRRARAAACLLLLGAAAAGASDAPRAFPAGVAADARLEYLRGRARWNERTPASLLAARRHFEQALLAQPDYAKAYAGLADAYTLLGAYGVLPADETYPRAKAAALEAIALDDNLAEAHTALAYALDIERDREGAEREYRRAMAIDPDYATAHHWYALTIAPRRFDEALRHIQIARRLAPLSKIIAVDAAAVYAAAGRHDEAERYLANLLLVDPDFLEARMRLADSYASRGRWTDALQALRPVAARDNLGIQSRLAQAYAHTGRTEEAIGLYRTIEARAAREFVPPLLRVEAAAARGDRDALLRWLRQGVERREPWVDGLARNPMLARYLEDPEVRRLLHGN